MTYDAASPEEYIRQLPEDRKQSIERLRTVILDNLPDGFEETMAYGMISYVVPHRIYPAGYHANPKEPLPFISIASQKNYIALYHMGIYAFPDVLAWFQQEYPKHVATKLDMGKGCVRFKKVETIPYELIAQLCTKISLADYLAQYEQGIKNKGK